MLSLVVNELTESNNNEILTIFCDLILKVYVNLLIIFLLANNDLKKTLMLNKEIIQLFKSTV